jgi:hypothetical protein
MEAATQHDIASFEIERMALAFEHDESEVARVLTERWPGGTEAGRDTRSPSYRRPWMPGAAHQ